MAPFKRRAHVDLDDDTDLDRDGSESVSSSQTASRKRRRLTNGNSILEDSESGTPPRPTSWDSDDDEEYEWLATQAIQEKYSSRKPNVPAESGILEEVRVENFMCHEICIFDVGPLINFVCGKNGSGKSAILTAITLCLGGKAGSTNRGSKLSQFIKEGKENGYIQVKLKNRGDLAYMPEVYGETIIVERHFSRSGTSGFKLKSMTGKIISTKKGDLEDICDHFSLQIDNPMNVLSQDQARSFISTSSAAEKYNFFVKGVQLEQLDQDYRLIEDTLDQIELKLEAKRPDIETLKKHMDLAKKKQEESQKHAGILDRLRNYRRQLAWAQVQEQEQIRDEYVKEIEIATTKIAEVEEEVIQLHSVYEEADRKSNEATGSYERAEELVKHVLAEKAEEKIKHAEVKKETVEAKAEQRTIRTALMDADSTISVKQGEIHEEEQRLADLDGGGAAARLAALEEARNAVKVALQNQQRHQELKQQLVDDEQEALKTYKNQEGEIKTKREELNRQQENFDAFASNQGQQDSAFPPQMPALLRAIAQEQRFAQKPVGPVGRHVRLLKPAWSSILEKSFGSTLSGFIVTSKSDMNLLKSIMNKVRCFSCPVLICNNQPLDTRPHEPDEQFDTPLRVLEIDNDLVRKLLVIQHGIEQTVLIASLEEATTVLFEGPRPRNVKRCYSIDPNNKRRGFMLSYTRTGEASQDPMLEYTGRSRMKTDAEAQLRLQREALEDSKTELLRLENELLQTQNAHQAAKQATIRHKKQEQELRIMFQQAEDKVEEVSAAIQEDAIEGGRLEVLRAALTEAERAKTLHEGSYQDSVIALDAKQAQLASSRTTLAAFDQQIEELQESSKRLNEEAQKLSKKRAQALGDKNAAINRIDDANQDRGSLERKKNELSAKIEDWIELATNICPRINVDEGETEKSLKIKYDKLSADYERLHARLGASREQVAADAARTSAAYELGKKEFRQLEIVGEKLKMSLIERRARWHKFRSFISHRAKAQFTFLLSERSFRGSLITDHREKLLELSVEPDITKKNGDGRGARTLSGGEKSFSQICLLLSIWEAMGSPIRCLDEFDVYMDAVNRSMSVNMLIDAARLSAGRQFILISPGTKSDIKSAPDVKAIELEPPVRGQTRLTFANQ